MEPTLNNTLKSEDLNLLAFRRRNKIIILIFSLLILSITIILAASITYLLHNNTPQQTYEPKTSLAAAFAFCHVSYNISSCRTTVYPIIKTKSISDPNQIFTIFLQTASKEVQSFITEPDLANCSSSLRDALSQIGDTMAMIRVNPFVEALSNDQWVEMMNGVHGAGENIGSCLDGLDKVNGSMVMIEKLGRVNEIVKNSEEFLRHYDGVMQMFWSMYGGYRAGLNSDILFIICMCGLQFMFVFLMFCSLRRIH